MSLTSDRRPVSRFVAVTGVLGLVLSALLVLVTTTTARAAGPVTFPGENLGAIPDGSPACDLPPTPRDVTFNVTGMPARALTDVRVTGLTVAHTWVGDLTVTLIAPDGTTSMLLFGRTGAVTAGDLGDNSNTAGPYTFADTDDPTPGSWWSAATAALGTDDVLAAGSYRTSTEGIAGGGGLTTSLTAAFSGLAELNGTWKLRFIDRCLVDVGTVTAATLSLTVVPSNCAAEQAAVTAAQNDASAAAAAAATATADKAAADAAVATADAKVAAADAKVAVAGAKVAAVNAKAATAKAKVAKAKAKLKKAKKALKTAKAGGDPAKIAKAKKKVAKAKAKRKAAKAGLKAASAELSAATSEQATAKSEQTAAKSEQATAAADQAAAADALAAADAAQAAADDAVIEAQAALAACEASRPGRAGRG